MIELRDNWPSIAAEIPKFLAECTRATLPPESLVLEMLDPLFWKKGFEISKEDVFFASSRMKMTAEQYLLDSTIERTRPAPNIAKKRLETVARLTLDLMEALTALGEKPFDGSATLAPTRESVTPKRNPVTVSHAVTHVLETVILSRQGNEEASAMLLAGNPSALDVGDEEAVLESGYIDQLISTLSELSYAADSAAQLPLGTEDLAVWPQLGNPTGQLRAVEAAADEMAQMYGMLLGELPSPSRYREPPEVRQDGPLITPLCRFFDWIEESHGIPAPSPSSLEAALRRALRIPRSLIGSQYPKPPKI